MYRDERSSPIHVCDFLEGRSELPPDARVDQGRAACVVFRSLLRGGFAGQRGKFPAEGASVNQARIRSQLRPNFSRYLRSWSASLRVARWLRETLNRARPDALRLAENADLHRHEALADDHNYWEVAGDFSCRICAVP
jgi:hypothetical protein